MNFPVKEVTDWNSLHAEVTYYKRERWRHRNVFYFFAYRSFAVYAQEWTS